MNSDSVTATSPTINTNQLQDTIIKNGYCVGCGACAAIPNSPFKMELNKFGFIQPVVKSQSVVDVTHICPFESGYLNEDSIAKELFSKECSHDTNVGYYLENFAGYVEESNYREAGGSGGMVTWVISQLFKAGLIDGVLHVKEVVPSLEDTRLFKYVISRSVDEARSGAKSRYYPVEMSEIIHTVRNAPGRYAVVGLPCFLKALRLLAKQDKVIEDRLKYHIGLVCGHLKSTQFADMMAWQNGIHPKQLSKINFRHKLEGSTANDYAISVEGIVNESIKKVIQPVSKIYAYDWGVGLFKYEACDYCDDVFGEVADITIGDAWLPEYVADGRGTNVVVVRRQVFKDLIMQGLTEGKVKLNSLSIDDTIASQAGGLRHRRDGLSYRLFLKDNARLWRPSKRVKASNTNLDARSKKIFEFRMWLRKIGITAFNDALIQDDFKVFTNVMDIELKKYYALYDRTFSQKFVGKLKKYLRPFKPIVKFIFSTLGLKRSK